MIRRMCAPRMETGRAGGKGSSSFLKKRTKKLLLMRAGVCFRRLGQTPAASSKSFLVLFFKKELLPFSPLISGQWV